MVKELGQSAVRDTADLLHSATVHLLRRAATADVGMNLDGPRASLLSVLVFGGPQPISRLAEAERVSPPAITKLVDALEAAGLVRRNRSTADRRIVLVEATPAGRRILQRGRAARVNLIATLLAGATRTELATLERAAKIIESRLGRNQ
ncbi:MAG TPA: MarR family transcriptional regulator [Actinophytocola sp.]|uniref:MarR family winged helix-turn-helix transcriptional regulator n=1 Tax=Actinophytocola sp. TaxID=1872138 RepID=UPI002DDDBB23|nr:MarR family transcriptional regulator [Actinophytocola sp.]HEV2780776.1 MarR family transcriptional regulator [Actinophytocola sp.]